MTTQTYANHVRWYPLVHFVTVPLLTVLIIYQVVRLFQEPSLDRTALLILILVIVMVNTAARLQALKAQDRVIRLEERLRYREILSPELAAPAAGLATGKLISLRFASDEELTELLPRVLSGELSTAKQIKSAIREWRGDNLRV